MYINNDAQPCDLVSHVIPGREYKSTVANRCIAVSLVPSVSRPINLRYESPYLAGGQNSKR